jgi:phosphoribosylamine--glycine ligase
LRVLVIGSGAREHAVAWAFSRSKSISGLFVAPGNAGTHLLAANRPDIDPMDFDAIVDSSRRERIDLVFIGPEAPLAAGLADRLRQEGISSIGPPQKAARLEASKLFSKRFMRSHGIPTARAEEYTDWRRFQAAVKGASTRIVIKKNGLAGGKGVLESDDPEALLDFGRRVLETDGLLVEEYLEGYEVSVFVFTDGRGHLLLPVCADFKKAGEGDTGLNTGGMGAVCPVPTVEQPLLDRIERQIVVPTLQGMAEEGLAYAGVLYFGLMITEAGPKVLEYNVRLGDPETQVLLPVIASDFGNIMRAVLDGTVGSFPLSLKPESAVGVVVASRGYPGPYEKGLAVASLPPTDDRRLLVFHASTRLGENEQVLTGGGRCFTVVGLGGDILSASRAAYEAAAGVRFEGAWYRRDIGEKLYLE